MVTPRTLFRIFAGSLVVSATLLPIGCTKKPSQQEMSKLEESRNAAESAEKKLAELKAERMRLEAQLAAKQGELQKSETERDSLKNKVK